MRGQLAILTNFYENLKLYILLGVDFRSDLHLTISGDPGVKKGQKHPWILVTACDIRIFTINDKKTY